MYICTIHWRTNNIFNSLISHETNFFIQPLCSLRTQKKLLHFNLIPVCFVNFWSFKMLTEKKRDEIRFFKSNKRDKVNTKKYIIACVIVSEIIFWYTLHDIWRVLQQYLDDGGCEADIFQFRHFFHFVATHLFWWKIYLLGATCFSLLLCVMVFFLHYFHFTLSSIVKGAEEQQWKIEKEEKKPSIEIDCRIQIVHILIDISSTCYTHIELKARLTTWR